MSERRRRAARRASAADGGVSPDDAERRARLARHAAAARGCGRCTKGSDYYGGLTEARARELAAAASEYGCGGEAGRDALGGVCVTLWPVSES